MKRCVSYTTRPAGIRSVWLLKFQLPDTCRKARSERTLWFTSEWVRTLNSFLTLRKKRKETEYRPANRSKLNLLPAMASSFYFSFYCSFYSRAREHGWSAKLRRKNRRKSFSLPGFDEGQRTNSVITSAFFWSPRDSAFFFQILKLAIGQRRVGLVADPAWITGARCHYSEFLVE